jgi:hypothetical protein
MVVRSTARSACLGRMCARNGRYEVLGRWLCNVELAATVGSLFAALDDRRLRRLLDTSLGADDGLTLLRLSSYGKRHQAEQVVPMLIDRYRRRPRAKAYQLYTRGRVEGVYRAVLQLLG